MTSRSSSRLAAAVAGVLFLPAVASAQATSCETYRACARENRAKKRGVASNDGALEAAAKMCDASYASCIARQNSAPPGGYSAAQIQSTPADLATGLMGIMGAYLDREAAREAEDRRRALEEEERRLEREARLEAERERKRQAAEDHRRDLEASFQGHGGAGVLVDRDPYQGAFEEAGASPAASPATAEPDPATCADPVLRLANPGGCERLQARERRAPEPVAGGR